MSGLQNDWYVAGPDGAAIGPLSRVEVAQAQARGALAADTLAWHVEHSEWLPVQRVIASMTAVQAALPTARAPAQARAAGAVAKTAPASGGKPRADKRPPLPPPGRSGNQPPPRKSAAPARIDTNVEREARQMRETLAARAAPTGRVVQGSAAAAGGSVSQAASAEQFGIAIRRLLARSIDVLSIGILGAAIVWAVVMHNSDEAQAGVLIAPEPLMLLWLAVLALVPLETVLLGTVGTTPGKLALGLRVSDSAGETIGIGRAWQRAITVLWRGVGVGLPPLLLIAVGIAGAQTMQQGAAPWDRSLEIETRSVPMDNRRWQLVLVFVVGALFVFSAGVWSELALQLAQRAAE